MKKSVVTTLAPLIVVVMLSCAAGRAQSVPQQQQGKPAVSPSSTTPQAASAESGVVTGSVYQNSYFGLRLTIPAGWHIQGDDVKQEIKERGKASIVPKNEQDKTQIDAAVDRTLNLLTISKLPIGTPGQFNAVFMTIAEPVPLALTGPAYTEKLKGVLQRSQVPVGFLDSEPVETINGVPFHTFTITLGAGDNLVHQRYFFLLKKGYALGLITTIISDSDTQAMNGILKSVTVQ